MIKCSKNRLNRVDLIAGAAVFALGLLVLFVSSDYEFGSTRRMGPGYFPIGLGAILIVSGLAIALVDGRKGEGDTPLPRLPWRVIAAIAAAMSVFAFLIETVGLAASIFAAVFISSLAEADVKIVRALLVATGMAALSVLIFNLGLDFQVEAFPW